MGDFLNEFLTKSGLFLALAVFTVVALPLFGYFYNRIMDKLTSPAEHLSLYVLIGTLVNLVIGTLFSWKAGVLFGIIFALDGIFMIWGEFRRTAKKNRERRLSKNGVRKLPYKANGCIADAIDASKEAQRLMSVSLKNNGRNIESALPLAEATSQINLALSRLYEVMAIQNGNGAE